MKTASERRAAGEAPFCEHAACVRNAQSDLRLLQSAHSWVEHTCLVHLAALLRALVVQTLLDPATWARPEGWRP